MPALNAFLRGDFQRSIAVGNKRLTRLTAELTGANTEPVKLAAAALVKAWRNVLAVKGTEASPSAPGQAPHKVTGGLQKTIKTAVVDGVRRVGSGSFRLRLLETGASAHVKARRSTKGRKGKTRSLGYAFRLEARPSAGAALDRAAPQMTEVLVSEMQHKAVTARMD